MSYLCAPSAELDKPADASPTNPREIIPDRPSLEMYGNRGHAVAFPLETVSYLTGRRECSGACQLVSALDYWSLVFSLDASRLH
jgi:hypothetical protein